MDYEYRILIAEKELTHLREIQAISRAHQDAHGQSIAAIDTILQRVETNLERLSALQIVTEEKMHGLMTNQLAIGQKLQGLIEVLASEHSNGKKGQ